MVTQENEISFTLRAKGDRNHLESLLSLMEDSESMDIGKPTALPEGGVQLSGDCFAPTLADGMNALGDGLGFADFAKHLGLDIEVFSTGMRSDRASCEYFCEHLHANAAGELLACEASDVDGIFDWEPDESPEDVLGDWGLVPDDNTRLVPSHYIVIAGCPIDMYVWCEEDGKRDESPVKEASGEKGAVMASEKKTGETHGKYPYIDQDVMEERLDDPGFLEYAVVYYDEIDGEFSLSAITSTRSDAQILVDAEAANGVEAYVVKVSDALYPYCLR